MTYTSTCEECGQTFEAVYARTKQPSKVYRRRFCDGVCRANHRDKQIDQEQRREHRRANRSGPCTPETAQKLLDLLRRLDGGGLLGERLRELMAK